MRKIHSSRKTKTKPKANGGGHANGGKRTRNSFVDSPRGYAIANYSGQLAGKT